MTYAYEPYPLILYIFGVPQLNRSKYKVCPVLLVTFHVMFWKYQSLNKSWCGVSSGRGGCTVTNSTSLHCMVSLLSPSSMKLTVALYTIIISSVLSAYICRTYLWTISTFKKNHSLYLCFISGQIHVDYWQFCHRWRPFWFFIQPLEEKMETVSLLIYGLYVSGKKH